MNKKEQPKLPFLMKSYPVILLKRLIQPYPPNMQFCSREMKCVVKFLASLIE